MATLRVYAHLEHLAPALILGQHALGVLDGSIGPVAAFLIAPLDPLQASSSALRLAAEQSQ
jgi:hypothetical protein